jgi:beta-glucuronidase
VKLGDVDTYTQLSGMRTVTVAKGKIFLNNKEIYLKGFGMHEDFHLYGQAHSSVRMIKDFNLLKWSGANSFRTSHYPYDEEVYMLADKLGILVIDESPAVGLNAWGDYPIFTEERVNEKTLEIHLEILEQMYFRDKNHPSVIMWSVANEPSCYEDSSRYYFEALANKVRELDHSRPVTMVFSSLPPIPEFHDGGGYGQGGTKSGDFFDIICFNRYYSWYTDSGHLEDIELQLSTEIEGWHTAYPEKPVIIAEFGADAVPGMHSDPPVMFSEEYQRDLIDEFTKVFDKYSYVAGEHIWNFADFLTKQGLSRVIGNKKGVFTRERQPKLSAHFLKTRWHSVK